MGGYLAELTTRDEDISLEDYLPQGVFYWIGLSDAANEGTWRWMESHQDADYTNWLPRDPNGGDCVFKSVQPTSWSSHLGWADHPCTLTEWTGNGQIHALCEI